MMLLLREMKQTDIEDYVRWFTTETKWGSTDAPWEPFTGTVQEERENWTNYYEQMQKRSANTLCCRFEIEVDGVHVGWISTYRDMEWFAAPENGLAIGISIAQDGYRGKGYGRLALCKAIDYYRAKGLTCLYTQTWSGNEAMIALANKLGFKEIARKKEHREVAGKRYDALTFVLCL